MGYLIVRFFVGLVIAEPCSCYIKQTINLRGGAKMSFSEEDIQSVWEKGRRLFQCLRIHRMHP